MCFILVTVSNKVAIEVADNPKHPLLWPIELQLIHDSLFTLHHV